MTVITTVNPNYVRYWEISFRFQDRKLFETHIVARVQPRASKGHHGPVIATLFRFFEKGVPFEITKGDNLAR